MSSSVPIPGAWDTHVHAGPDVRPRKLGALALARKATDAQMSGLVLKNHHFPTAMLAGAVAEAEGVDISVTGTVVLNRSVGGLNVDAVSAAARMGALRVELPTVTAARNMLDQGEPRTIDLLDGSNGLSTTAEAVLDEAISAGLVVGTGHIGLQEIRAVVEYVTNAGGQIVITHPEFHAARDGVGLTPDDQTQLARENVYFERCFIATAENITSLFRSDAPEVAFEAFEPGAMFEAMVAGIEATGPDHNLVSTDYGQPDRELPPTGLGRFHQRLLDAGISKSALKRMARDNPEMLFGGA